jgi:hypothetical protein
MCLLTNQKKPLIAECDIVVYKLLSENANPIFFGGRSLYKLMKKYKTKVKRDKDDRSCFDDADSYALRKEFGDYIYNEDVVSYSRGFHSAIYPYRFVEELSTPMHDRCTKRVIFECIIPKGSEYYTNPSGLLVSNQIIVIRMYEQDNMP